MVTGESAGRSRKSVWFDICHTPQYNFYKNFIIRLAEEGHVVYLTVLDRGKNAFDCSERTGCVSCNKDLCDRQAQTCKMVGYRRCQFDTDCQTVFMVIG